MYDKEKDKLKEQIEKHLKIYTLEDFKEFVDSFFNERASEDIDFDYISKVGIQFTKYIDEVLQKVNSFAQTFEYRQMDPLDQAIFLL
jgi:hypothetical protein